MPTILLLGDTPTRFQTHSQIFQQACHIDSQGTDTMMKDSTMSIVSNSQKVET